ncbi:MAG: methylated-DNA--[protein]-cysteine S-methyltransferase [Planctomycetota bacterium]|nr:methylated-DNA--[protein]-cysteine S-methyltransferase [Planctomycetota bacterium]
MKVFDTPFGRMAVAATARGLTRVLLPAEAAALQVSGVFPAPDRVAAAFAARAEREILQYLAGRRRKFTVPVDLSAVPPFHAKVLRALARVPYGRTVTYSALAARVGRPHGARAIGQAMARNPVPLVLPCHRVVACGGGLGGFGGGVALKRRLLDLEGAG